MYIRHLALKLKGSEYIMTVNSIIINCQCVFTIFFFKYREVHNFMAPHILERSFCTCKNFLIPLSLSMKTKVMYIEIKY